MNEDIVIPIVMFGSTAFVLWKMFDSRQKVRIAALEKGSIDENIKYLFGNVLGNAERKPSRLGTLKWGLAAAFIGFALLLSIPLQAFDWGRHHQGELITGLIFAGVGLAFLVYYGIAKKADERER